MSTLDDMAKHNKKISQICLPQVTVSTHSKMTQENHIVIVTHKRIFIFYLQVFSSGAGYDIHQIVNTCNSSDNLNPEKRDGVIAYITSHVDRLLGK